MKCLKCGANISDQASFCKYCGTRTTNTQTNYNNSSLNNNSNNDHEKQYNYSYQYSNKKNPTYSSNNEHSNQINYSYQYSNDTNNYSSADDKFLSAYVGLSYNSIKNQKFSLSTLFLGPYYLAYRKLWEHVLIYLIVIILTKYFIPGYTTLVIIALNFFYAKQFREIYMNKAIRKVEQIKQSNLDKTSQELYEEVREKGKGNAFIITILIIITILTPIVYSVYQECKENINYEEKNSNKEEENHNQNIETGSKAEFNEIQYFLPENTTTISENQYINYYLISTYDHESQKTATCNFLIRRIPLHEDLKTYLNNSIIPNIIQSEGTIPTNNANWIFNISTLNDRTYTTFATSNNNYNYIIQGSNSNLNQEICHELYLKIIKSTSFKN